MNWKNLLIIIASVGILLLIFIPFIMQPERVYKEINLLIIIGLLGFSLIYSYPHMFSKNKHGDILLVGTNSLGATVFIFIILGLFIYRPFIEMCKPLVELMPTIVMVLFMNYFMLVIWFKLQHSKFKINWDNIHTIAIIVVVGSNILWIVNNVNYILPQIQKTLQCF